MDARDEAEAYLDIETTGLSPWYDQATVVGVSRGGLNSDEVVQLVGQDITARRLLAVLRGVRTIYTYNGRKFDMLFLKEALGVDLEVEFEHKDLVHACWAQNLYGGLKAVERQLGIPRLHADVNGAMAVTLWFQHLNHGDAEALKLLLAYNREDVLNLKKLRQKLEWRACVDQVATRRWEPGRTR